jgi:hypothetical protein
MLGDGVHDEPLSMAYQQGVTLTPGGVTAAIVPGDAPPPGVLSAGDQANPIDGDFAFIGQVGGYPGFYVYPMAVLQPNWALVFQGAPANTGALGLCLFWEAILPKYFDRFYTHQLLEIELALKG